MADITIRGAGIFGLAIGYECARRGAKLRIVDPNGVGAGSSGGIVGALAPHVPEQWNEKKAFQFQSLLDAEPFWHQVEAISGLSTGYLRSGRLQSIVDAPALALARQRAESARDLWQGHAYWEVIPVPVDWSPLSPTGYVIHDTLTARLHPRLAVNALARAIQELGGEITTRADDQGKVLWATGVSDLKAISAARPRVFGNAVKGQAALFSYEAAALPQIFSDSVHIVPHQDGTLAIGSTSERDFGDPTSTDAQLDDLIARAHSILPCLRKARVIERWAGLRPRSRSRAPVLGRHPLYPQAYIANGGFKIGFGMAVGVARIMADLLLEGKDSIPHTFRVEQSL